MKTIERVVVSLGIVLCACFLSKLACDEALTIRHVIWGVTTLLLFIMVLLRADKIDFGVTKLLIFKVFFIMVIFTYLSLFKALNLSESLYGCMKITVAFVYFVILALIIDRKMIVRTMTLLAVGLGIYGIYQLILWSTGNLIEYIAPDAVPGTPNEVYGTMCNKNLWSECFVLLLPFCFCSKKGSWRIAGWIGACLILINIYFLFSRSAILTLCVYVMIIAMFVPKYRVKIIFLGAICSVIIYTFKPDLVENALCTFN